MNKRKMWHIDWVLIVPVIVLVMLSLATLFSINVIFFRSQLIFLALSVFAYLLFSQINYKIIQVYSLPIYIASIVLLTIVLFLGIESRGSVRWIELFGFRIQFSEFLKPFLAISLSSFLASRKNYSFKNLVSLVLFSLPLALLIFLQPDLGNALIYISVVVLSLFFFGFPLRFFVLGFLLLSSLIPFFWYFLHGYQKQRILTFLNPAKDPLGSSYNAIQSIIAVGSGMILGRGLGQGTQSGLYFLPERHTDFIFATISEEFGFIGSIVVLLAFAFVFYKIFKIVVNSQDRFCKTFAATAFFLILVQFFVNIGMNIGLLPIVGVTLPFVSYGGSSLLSSFILLGLISAVNKSVKDEDVLQIR